jgi:hypothetical protein
VRTLHLTEEQADVLLAVLDDCYVRVRPDSREARVTKEIKTMLGERSRFVDAVRAERNKLK